MKYSIETIVVAILIAIFAISILSSLLSKRQPKEKTFKCGRCGVVSPHTDRTIEAWRNDKVKFFCASCHAKWLQSRPVPERQRFQARSSSSGNSGCLGVLLLFAVVPFAGYFFIRAVLD